MTRVTAAQQKFLREQKAASDDADLNKIRNDPKSRAPAGETRKWQDLACKLDSEVKRLQSLLDRHGVETGKIKEGRLSIQFIERQDLKPGLYGDGCGLYLQVSDLKTKSWIVRFMIAGRARKMGIGAIDRISLAEARIKAREAHLLVVDGIDPIADRDIKKTVARTKNFVERFGKLHA